MAVVRIPDQDRCIDEPLTIKEFLAGIGIRYEQCHLPESPSREASAEQILQTHSGEIERLKAEGGYITADVIDVSPSTPGLDAMLAKFSVEHWHDEDEVRLIVAGRGLFHVHPANGPVVAIEVESGDLIRVPRGTLHWFDLSGDRRIRAIRLFQDKSGWTPYYRNSAVDKNYQPVCWGPQHIPIQLVVE